MCINPDSISNDKVAYFKNSTTMLCRPLPALSLSTFFLFYSTENWHQKVQMPDIKKLEETASPNVKKTGQRVVSSDIWTDCTIWARMTNASLTQNSNLSDAPEKKHLTCIVPVQLLCWLGFKVLQMV